MSISDLKLSKKELLKYAETCQSTWELSDEYLFSNWYWDGFERVLNIHKNECVELSIAIPPYSCFSTDKYTFFFYSALSYKYQSSVFAIDKNNIIIVLSNKNKNETKQ